MAGVFVDEYPSNRVCHGNLVMGFPCISMTASWHDVSKDSHTKPFKGETASQARLVTFLVFTADYVELYHTLYFMQSISAIIQRRMAIFITGMCGNHLQLFSFCKLVPLIWFWQFTIVLIAAHSFTISRLLKYDIHLCKLTRVYWTSGGWGRPN